MSMGILVASVIIVFVNATVLAVVWFKVAKPVGQLMSAVTTILPVYQKQMEEAGLLASMERDEVAKGRAQADRTEAVVDRIEAEGTRVKGELDERTTRADVVSDDPRYVAGLAADAAATNPQEKRTGSNGSP